MGIMSWNLSCCLTFTLLTCFLSSSAGVTGLGQMQNQQQQVVTLMHPGTGSGGAGQFNFSFIQEVAKNCSQYCSDQLQYKSVCINQGCKQWKTGLQDGCGVVCNGTEANFLRHFSCQHGCSRAAEEYLRQLKGILGVPDPPTLIAGSLKSTTLRLSWEGSLQSLPYLVFNIQRRFYQRNQDWPWETVTTEPLNQTSFMVQELKPYTEYQFRIGWILANDFPTLDSMESNPIQTHSQGLPNSPEITSVQSISNTSVAITWLPPSQANGPLVAYILKLHNPSEGLVIKEIQFRQNPKGYTFAGLLPNTNYTLTITAQNLEGEGEPTTVSFATPQSSMSNDISKKPEPRLVIQGIQDIFMQGLDPLSELDTQVFKANQNITAMAVHVKRNWAFVAVADGQVIRTELEGNRSIVILPKERLDIWVSFLSVDWLNQRLYIVGNKKRSPSTWCIKKCDLNGERCTFVYSYLGAQPVEFMADPYTGYMYWVSIRTHTLRAGLYKMDLIEEYANNPNSLPLPPIMVYQGADVGPFTIDFANYRILLVDRSRNTIVSISLDGSDMENVRGNTQSPQFGDALSLSTYEGIFYWTTGQSLVIEEYNEEQNSYYQNSYDVSSHQPCSRVFILHPDLQPIPRPMAPPRLPQVIFSQTQARIMWRPPATIANLGEGAWTDWKYQIRLADNTSVSNITGLEYTLENLKPSTYYSIQVRAYSPSGRGPLSDEPFRGRTLRQATQNISILWGTEEGLFSTNILGENVQQLVLQNQWRASNENWTITSLAYQDSTVFFALTNGSVFMHGSDASTAPPSTATRLKGISFAQSLAYDYIGDKLYWSNPKRQAIFRCNVRDLYIGNARESCEWLPIVTMAKEIAIDSYKALLLWTTGHSLEMSKLNGYNHNVLYSIGIFSGIRIIGITLDTEQSRIYWINRSFGGSTLMKLSYGLKSSQSPVVIANYPETTILGPVSYFNDRLLWLQGTSDAVIADLYGEDKKSLMTVHSVTNISTILVKDQSVQRFPNGLPKGKLNVAPNPVLAWSITVSGKWNNFTISWKPVNNTNFDKIFYQVKINDHIEKPVTQPYTSFQDGSLFKPYTEIDITIIALTYWTSSKPVIVKTHTPPGKPSAPINPRIFLETVRYPYTKQQKNVLIRGELRWDPIQEPNGIIIGYTVHCWKNSAKTAECNCEVDLEKLSCELKNLSRDATYQFAVQGVTRAGAGSWSRRVQTNPKFSNPVPKLLVAANDKLQILDIDRNAVKHIPSGYLTPMTATYIAADDMIYWFDEGQDLLQSRLDGTNKTRVYTLTSMEASYLTVDWIGRKLYWIAEVTGSPANQNDQDEKYHIMRLDLTEIPCLPQTIIKSRTAIKSIAVNPFSSSILWTTSKRNGIMTLYSSRLDGSSVEPFLSRDSLNCNCSTIGAVGEAIAFDATGYGNLKHGIVISDHQSIWLADQTGCECHQIVNMSAHGISTVSMNPPFRVAVDEHHVYWVSNYLYASEKPGIGITELNSFTGPTGVREVLVLGPSVQPYPDLQCLLPSKLEPGEPSLLNVSSYTFQVQLPVPYPLNCSYGSRTSLPTPKYEVYYGTVNEKGIAECSPSSLNHCGRLNTSKPNLEITNLHPYTTYTIFVSVTNYYAASEGLSPLMSSPRMLRTAPGAPMPPKLLRLEPLTPVSVRVVWGKPEKLNGETVWYQVEWQSPDTKSSPGFMWWGDKNESRNSQNQAEYSLDIRDRDLKPFTNYSVWVNAFSAIGDTRSQSEIWKVETFPNPPNVTLISATPHSLSLAWKAPDDTTILRHQIIYHIGWSSEWNKTDVVNSTVPGRTYNLSIMDLKPKTLYGFVIKTWYKGDPQNSYNWPKEGQFTMETLADKPGPPSTPVARGIGKSLYEISWDKADENGAAVDLYNLECKLDADNAQIVEKDFTSGRKRRELTQTELTEKLVSSDTAHAKSNQLDWMVVYNGTDSRWQVKGLDPNSHYSFRARARNIYGWGEYSQESPTVVMSALTIVAETQNVGAILGIIFLGILILGIFGFLFIYVYHQKLKEKPALLNSLPSDRRDVELATLRELPVGSSFIHQSNILYAAGEFILDLEMAGVPRISSSQIQRTKFLGRGAFGEVHEGIATHLPGFHDEPNGIRVAVKTLRKGATHRDKIEFMQEAKLMTQFRHPHILQLIGVCVDLDPCCLLLEIMDGGDLLSYLRANRRNPGLTLHDLLSMCVDVANGCVYLEDLHFVHRDLAARNCLVRLVDSPDPNSTVKHRVVKIGDFGLARDIYRNDYYRKDGKQALLPVRWLPPEALVDGVYTTQSDIWAFGVLLWEIMTLGQQPYAAASNIEVVHFVVARRTLQPPNNCPDAMGSLMLQCWEFEAKNRPSFKDCLAQLLALLQDDMRGYFQDHPQRCGIENANEKNGLWKRQDQCERDNDSVFGGAVPGLDSDYLEHTPPSHLTRGSTGPSFPKYLEVVGDDVPPSDGEELSSPSYKRPVEEDGYEIPLPKIPIRNPLKYNSMTNNDFGIPIPPYWNTKPCSPGTDQNAECQYFAAFRRSTGTGESESETESHYRNLLPSSTSEEVDGEMDNECLSSDDQPESMDHNICNNIFHLKLNPSLLPHCRTTEAQQCSEISGYLDDDNLGSTISPEVPSASSAESDYGFDTFYHHYYNNNRPCVNAANSG